MKKKLVYLLLLMFPLLAGAVRVSPVRYDVSLTRGSSKDFVINLTGTQGLHTQDLAIYPSDLSMDRRGALAFDSLKVINANKLKKEFYGSLANSAVNWIKIQTTRLSLFEKQTRQVKFKVTVPANAVPGEYYAIIMVEPKKFELVKGKNDPVRFKIKARVAIVFVLDVPGRTYEKKGEVENLKVVGNGSYVKVVSSFKNSGNVHLDVAAKVNIRRAADQTSLGIFTVKAINSSQERAFVFPGAIRDFEGTFSRLLPAGDYLAEISYDYGYSFRTAKKIWKFTVKRDIPPDESQALFLAIEPQAINLILPANAMRTQVVKLTNLDYRPLNVTITSPGKLATAYPDKFCLKAGEIKNIQIIVKVPQYEGNSIAENLLFKTERGKSETVKVVINQPGAKNGSPSNKKGK